MTVALFSMLAGLVAGMSRQVLAKLILLAWFMIYAAILGPMLMMPGAKGAFGDSATVGMIALPAALGAGWLVGLWFSKLWGQRVS
ncbi:hypothetical protein [uncultured Sulfitobacter sp.]|uniref:hypothetical protein n=1 Tax=uncultured Sulfitobacter sp. TaxID=191468 RepID=UPI0026207812|nr:hypothetical protein [uncultured Sulfitobacter sp.]